MSLCLQCPTQLCFSFMLKLKVCVTFCKFGGGVEQGANTFLNRGTSKRNKNEHLSHLQTHNVIENTGKEDFEECEVVGINEAA